MGAHKRIRLWIFMMIAYTSGSCSEGIMCYKCTITPQPGSRDKTSQICSRFEKNSDFHVLCPKSTLCMKRTIHHKLVNGTIVQTSVERGCAPQHNVFKIYDNGIWRDKEEIVENVYKKGCFIGEDRGGPGGPPEYCFCNYHLCNGSQTFHGRIFASGIIFPSLLIIIQYLRVF